MTIDHRWDLEADTVALTLGLELTGTDADLLSALGQIREARQTLAVWEAEVVERLAARLEVGTRMEVDGTLWRVKRGRGKVQWDHDGIRSQVLGLARGTEHRKVTADGEIESPEEAAVRIVYAVAGIGYYRTGDLGRFGLDPDEWRASEPGKVEIVTEGP